MKLSETTILTSISLNDYSPSTSICSSSLTSVSSLDSTDSKIIEYELLSNFSERNYLNYALVIEINTDFETSQLFENSFDNLKCEALMIKIVSNKTSLTNLNDLSMIKINQLEIFEDNI
jgi:hypothetical protein